VDGFRMDAVKHIDEGFLKGLIDHVRGKTSPDFFVMGEYWHADQARLNRFIDDSDQALQLFDVALHFRLVEASKRGRDYDLTHLFDDTLVSTNPFRAVTFVDNHDSQPGEALESWVEDWFKPIAHAMILLRKDGLPCVFYGDYYGINGGPASKKAQLDPLFYARKALAYGEQMDAFDHANVVGFVRKGDLEHPDSGVAVVASNGEEGTKRMAFGPERAGRTFFDLTGNRGETITLDQDGAAVFTVNGGSVSVWADEAHRDWASRE
jgi:alpha-amylase